MSPSKFEISLILPNFLRSFKKRQIQIRNTVMSQPYFIFLFTLVWMIPDLVDVHKKEGCMHLNEIFPM